MQQLSGQDALFLHAELEGMPQHIGILQIYDQSSAEGGLVRFKQILQLLQERLHLSPIFSRRLKHAPLGLDNPYWESIENLDVEQHVHHIALPKPGDWRQLCILTARLHARPLDMTRPLWEMYVIEGLDKVKNLPQGCFAVLWKIHHAALDGASGAQLIPLLHDLGPNICNYARPPEKNRSHYGSLTMLRRAVFNQARRSRDALHLAGSLLPAWQRIRRGMKEQDFSPLEDKQKTVFQGKISRHRVCDAVGFSFADVRAIKQSMTGATINDVMLCVVSGALRRYLAAHSALPEKTLVSGCPVDVRGAEERDAEGNMVGFMTVSLHSDVAEPLPRLRAIHQAALSSKAYADALGPRMAVRVTDVLPGGMLSLALRAGSVTGLSEAKVVFNTMVTNVPGPQQQLYFCGAKMVDAMTLGPLLPNVGLFHIIYSSVMNKQGNISISFTACREMMPDPDFYADCLRQSFTELCEAAELRAA